MTTYYKKQVKEIKKLQKPIKKLIILSESKNLQTVLETLSSYSTKDFTAKEKSTWSKLINMVEQNIEAQKEECERKELKCAQKEQRDIEKKERMELLKLEKEKEAKLKEEKAKALEKNSETTTNKTVDSGSSQVPASKKSIFSKNNLIKTKVVTKIK